MANRSKGIDYRTIVTAGLLLGGSIALAAWWRRSSSAPASARRGRIDTHAQESGSPGFNRSAAGGF
ncbi:MAG: hypothetical protein ACK4S4_04020 [Pyrinomonadaceae bacterium]